MVPVGSKAKRLSSVSHITKTIHHHHHLKVCKEISSDEKTDELEKNMGRMCNWTQYSLKFLPQNCNVFTLSSRRIGSTYFSIGDRRISAVTTTDALGSSVNEHLFLEKQISE